ncbi:MAG: hypothetical protein ACTHJQ_22645 [Rhizobiaceae bacterium]
MGGSSSSTPQGSLSSLFANNQSGLTGNNVTLPTITAPQSLIGQLDMGQLSTPSPVSQPQVASSATAPRTVDFNGNTLTAQPNFRADTSNPGYGWMNVMTGSEHGAPTYSQYYVSAPNQQPASQPPAYQPSQSALIAQLINKQFGIK